MKTKLIFFLAVFFLFSKITFGQGNTVLNYHSGTEITCIALNGDTAWVTTETAGLFKELISTGAVLENYTKYNSSLPTNSLDWVILDHAGNVWIAAEYEGLVKFDGTNWTVYNYSNSPFLRDYIFQMDVDASDNLYMSTASYGLVKFDGSNWTFYNSTNSPITSDFDHSVKVDNNNVVWLGTYAGLYRFDGTTWTNFDQLSTGFPINIVRDICLNGSMVWIATANGLAKYDGVNWTYWDPVAAGMPSHSLRSLNISGSNVWIGTGSSGAMKFDGINWTSYPPNDAALKDAFIRQIVFPSVNTAWFATGGSGIAKLQGNSSWTYQRFNNCNMNSELFNNVYIDQNNDKWLSCYDKGLLKFSSGNWTVYDTLNSQIPAKYISSVTGDANGNIWLPTIIGLVKFDGTNWTVFNSSNTPMNSDDVVGFTITPTGTLWVILADAVYSYDGVNWIQYDNSNSILPLYTGAGSITVDYNNHIWFTAEDYSGVYEFDGSLWISHNTTNSGIPSDYIISIYSDSVNNSIWFTSDVGLIKLNGVSWTTYDSTASGISLTYVNNMTYVNGNYWIEAGDHGLLKFDGTNWTQYDIYNSDLPAAVYSVQADQHGNLWLSSAGLTEFNENGIVSVNDPLKQDESISVYPNPSHGIFHLIKSKNTLIKESMVTDVNGRTVFVPKSISPIIDLSSQPSGVYLLRVTDNSGQSSRIALVKD
jgi:ligand-binding sensor domain-containing protein